MINVNVTLDFTAEDIQNLDPNKVEAFVGILEKCLSDNIIILVPGEEE